MAYGEERPCYDVCDCSAHRGCTCPVHENGCVHALDYPRVGGRENLGIFLKIFRTWTCLNRCDSAIDAETAVNTSGTQYAELERLHEYNMIDNSLKAWQTLTKALEKETETNGKYGFNLKSIHSHNLLYILLKKMAKALPRHQIHEMARVLPLSPLGHNIRYLSRDLNLASCSV